MTLTILTCGYDITPVTITMRIYPLIIQGRGKPQEECALPHNTNDPRLWVMSCFYARKNLGSKNRANCYKW